MFNIKFITWAILYAIKLAWKQISALSYLKPDAIKFEMKMIYITYNTQYNVYFNKVNFYES